MTFDDLIAKLDTTRTRHYLFDNALPEDEELGLQIQEAAIREGKFDYLWQLRAELITVLDNGCPHGPEDCAALGCPPMEKRFPGPADKIKLEKRYEAVNAAMTRPLQEGRLPAIFKRIVPVAEEWWR